MIFLPTIRENFSRDPCFVAVAWTQHAFWLRWTGSLPNFGIRYSLYTIDVMCDMVHNVVIDRGHTGSIIILFGYPPPGYGLYRLKRFTLGWVAFFQFVINFVLNISVPRPAVVAFSLNAQTTSKPRPRGRWFVRLPLATPTQTLIGRP